MTPRSFLISTVAVLVCVAASGPALAEVDVAVGNGDKVTGTLLPASEIETFRINVPQGATFKLKVKGKAASRGSPKPPATLRLFDPSGTAVGGEFLKRKKTSATLSGYAAEATGEYRVEVSGDDATSGNYILVVKWKAQKKYVFELDDGGPGEPSQVALPLDAGAKLKLKLQAAKGSVATPDAQQLIGPDVFQLALDDPEPGAASHSLKNIVVPEFGDTQLIASGGGAYRCTVKVVAPPPAKRKIVLTGDAIGGKPFAGGDNAVGKVIAPSGGTVAISGIQSPIVGGASVLIPSGALSGPTAVLIGESQPLPNQQPGQQAAGPSVFFGPEGLTFEEDVFVTIPWDSDAFSDASDEEIKVFTRDQHGNVTEIPRVGLVFDRDAGTCTFPVSHFSSFRVFGPRLPAPATGDLDSDGTGDIILSAPFNGAGVVYVTPGGMALQSGSTASAPIVLTGEAPGDRFGAYSATCDLNQDGREDLVVSATKAGGGDEGLVYVFFGGPSGGQTPAFPSRSAAQADAVLRPESADFDFGIRLDCGDVNGDGIEDLVIGAQGSSVGVSSGGAVYVFYGAPEFSSRTSVNADVRLLGKRANGAFGAAVAVGDVTGDGIADVVVGADERSVPDTGAVYVFAGGSDLKSLKSNKADFSMRGAAVGDRFGLELAVGDVDGDLKADVIISSPGDDEGGDVSGAVFVHFGGRLNDAPAKLVGGSPGDDFGYNLAAGDLQNDGLVEILATSGHRASDRGALHIFAGSPNFASQSALSATSVITGENGNDVLRVVQKPHDVNGDGFADVIAYAPGANSDAGRAYVFFGGPALPASGSAAQAPLVYDGQPGDALGGDPIP